MKKRFIIAMLGLTVLSAAGETPKQISGVYPHLTMYNNEGECGTGAVVPWGGKLWVITYAPHKPMGSSDKLYEISADLKQTIRPESIGGTPANRMVHKESKQLVIGPYFIKEDGTVRTIPYKTMPGRHTGTARHLTDPTGKVYTATMEEGLYTIDVNDLSVTEHIKDGNGRAAVGKGVKSKLPGYHGKGLYTAQGFLVYANNGEHGQAARTDPTTSSGSLASWQGEGDWSLIRRNQFTEVTGPGGIYGNGRTDDPLWAMGWDYRSLILMLLDDGKWTAFRLPKGSHSYDGAHGWNTEWPRIRDISEDSLLATMHGTFWHFPKTFSASNTAGIRPRSNYLKVIGDFAKWNGKLVLGCDDSAQKEFLNHRPFKSTKGAPVQSNSNLWFIEPGVIDDLGPAIGRGSVWLNTDLQAGQVSDPYLFAGYDYRTMVISHRTGSSVSFKVEVDAQGDGNWTELSTHAVSDSLVHIFPADVKGEWVRVTAEAGAKAVSVHFHYRDKDSRSNENQNIFAPISKVGEVHGTSALIRSNRRVLSVAAGKSYFEVNDKLSMTAKPGDPALETVRAAAQPAGVIRVDAGSALIVEDGKRYRLPKNDAYRASAKKTNSKGAESKPETIDDVIGDSLAVGATVTASSTHETYNAKFAVDGKLDEASRWIGSGSGEKTIEIDFGAERTFRCVCVVSGWNRESAYAMSSYTVEVEQAGSWTVVPGGTVTVNTAITRAINFKKPLTARKLRLRANDVGFVRVYEIGVFNRPMKFGTAPTEVARICREVATERDLFNFDGTFYELPARNAQGFGKIRPIATHNLAIHDYASHFGLLFMTGLNDRSNSRIIASGNGKAAVWAGVIDDLWKMGKPRGEGGPWKDSAVKADAPSDPYLMTGYDKKSVALSTDKDAVVTLEVDIDGTGVWVEYKTFNLEAGKTMSYKFPEGFSAYWVRTTSNIDTTASAWFVYE